MKFFPLLTCVLIVMMIGCGKTGPVQPIENNKKLFYIKLGDQFMGADKVDSALVYWKTRDRTQVVKLALSNDSLLTDISSFAEGDGELTIQLFSRITFQTFYSSVWVQRKTASIKHNQAIQVSGPEAFTDINWSPRVLLKDGIGHYAIVALRPDDPYFYVKEVGPEVLKMVVARMYWKTKGGVSAVGGAEWECRNGCTNSNGDIENEDFFKGLPNQIGTRSWNHIEITIVYETDKWGGGYVLSLNHSIS